MMRDSHLFVIKLDEQRYAVQLAGVARVVRMVAMTGLPKTPTGVLGVINLQGEVLPVLDLRSLLGHGARPVQPEDVLVIAESRQGRVALAADGVEGVLERSQLRSAAGEETQRHSELVEGVVKLPQGLVMICDLEKIASLATGERELDYSREYPQVGETEGGESGKILRERARKLALEVVAGDLSPRLEVVQFLLSDELYAIESGFIREVYPLKELTPLPCTPPFVLGIVNLRGKILSVIDMRKFFELPDKGLSDLNKIIVLEGGGMEFGLLADAIVGVTTVAASRLQPSLPTLTGIRSDYLKGVTGDRLVVLDAGKMLSDQRIVVHEEV